jgi:hypothetical protein
MQFLGHVDIFHMFTEMGNDEQTVLQLKSHDSRNPAVFLIIPTVGGTGPYLTAANNVVVTQMISGLKEQQQVFARVAQVGQN